MNIKRRKYFSRTDWPPKTGQNTVIFRKTPPDLTGLWVIRHTKIFLAKGTLQTNISIVSW